LNEVWLCDCGLRKAMVL